MYLFGSRLMKRLLPPDLAKRVQPRDTDLVTPSLSEYLDAKSRLKGSREIEVYHLPSHPNREMTLDELYTLKVSHAIYSIKWNKTMSHIYGLSLGGAKVIPDFLTELRDFWATYHVGKKYRRFDFTEATSRGDLFDDNVKREQHHDELHLLLTRGEEPAYHLVAPGGGVPQMDLWNNLSYEQRLEVVLQEALVLLLERGGGLPFPQAFYTSSEALVTRLHPLPIADWVIMNWREYMGAAKTHPLAKRAAELSSRDL